MKFLIIEYETALKMVVLNRLYFNNKNEIADYLKISPQSLENFIHGKISGKRKSLSILQRIDIFRKYQYNLKTVEKRMKIGIKDFESMLSFTKENLKHIQELQKEIITLKNKVISS